ncbi:DNA-binding transcriptional LysR family regulator [Pullulanibacillus pueri]|uniref:LysR family transcriptional regulator n=1 Tax=Pullulanibacillus pueri TaxID=1437324 RepID=A0A8J3EKM9_9BACL|nr:LysR family transcriptional regulator [Pullulanibacillus pueri]MBM7681271.1 DNA-binding transcriptional LysR family regulator [Pullulanibacillus pueri]GGH77803.1 LysR family transcriptional regulator [Pullulanibacillus pueri]
MNLHALRLFYTVTKCESVTAAAEQLRISQPAVTAQIKKFERELGLPLFKPKGRGVILTEFGESLAKQAKHLFALEQHMESTIEAFLSGKKGKIRIVATYLPANFLIPEWAATFKTQYEEVDITITTTNSQGAFEQLSSYEADIAVYGGGAAHHPDTIAWEELFEDELWFVVAPQHHYAHQEVSLEEMMTEPFIMREEGSSTRERLVALCQSHDIKPPTVALQFNGLHEAIRTVMAGYGVNFISSLVVRDYVARGELARVKVRGLKLVNKIALCTRKHDTRSPLVNHFIETVKKNV